MKKLLEKAERKFGRYAIPNLVKYIVMGMAVVYLMDIAVASQMDISLAELMAFNKVAIVKGEVWRVLTFLIYPPDLNPIFIFFSLYFLWLVGDGLEEYWGSFKLNIFYFCGMLCSLIVGLIFGYATNEYINLSLFFAFAILYPNFELSLFFILRIPVKYFAILDLFLLTVAFFVGNLSVKMLILISFANLFLFFGGAFITKLKNIKRRRDFQKKINRKK